MRIFITGAAGFIGTHLWKYLEDKGHEVKGIDNFSHDCKAKNDKVKYADVRYYHDIENYVKWCDCVMHLAAQIHVDKSISNPQETLDINITGTLNILEAVRKYNKQMVFASSSEVYGTAQDAIMNERHQLDAQSPYAASKVAGDRLCKSYYDTYGTRVIILRNFNTFGEYQNDTSYGGVIAIFTKNALRGENLNVFGSGNQQRDYMYVLDAVRGYEFCMESTELFGRAVNIGTGRTITIKTLANIIIKLTKSKSEVKHVKARAGEVERLCSDNKLAESLGFTSKTDFEKDLQKYVNWYKQNIDYRSR